MKEFEDYLKNKNIDYNGNGGNADFSDGHGIILTVLSDKDKNYYIQENDDFDCDDFECEEGNCSYKSEVCVDIRGLNDDDSEYQCWCFKSTQELIEFLKI